MMEVREDLLFFLQTQMESHTTQTSSSSSSSDIFNQGKSWFGLKKVGSYEYFLMLYVCDVIFFCWGRVTERVEIRVFKRV